MMYVARGQVVFVFCAGMDRAVHAVPSASKLIFDALAYLRRSETVARCETEIGLASEAVLESGTAWPRLNRHDPQAALSMRHMRSHWIRSE